MHDHHDPSARPTRTHARSRRSRAIAALGAALLVPLAVLGGAAAASHAGPAEQVREVFPPDTIVHIEGDAANGFGIKMLDGSWLFPPTDSEAIAECNEYDRRVQRIRCRVNIRTWYRDLAATKQTIEFYRSKGK